MDTIAQDADAAQARKARLRNAFQQEVGAQQASAAIRKCIEALWRKHDEAHSTMRWADARRFEAMMEGATEALEAVERLAPKRWQAHR